MALAIALSVQLFQGEDETTDGMTRTKYQDNLGFYVYGLVKDVSGTELILDQTFNRSYAGDNPAVRISLKEGASLLICERSIEGPFVSVCGPIEIEAIQKGMYACAQCRQLGGEVIGGKIFFNATCGETIPFPRFG